MKIKTVTIQNFLGLKEAVIELDDKGLVLIQGDNQDDTSADSNGAGKSSLIDAVCWACYGSTARDLSGDDVINHVAKKGCIVEVQVIDGDDEYTITRWRKASGFHKRSGVTLEVNGADKSGGTDAITQIAIDEVMGCSSDVFNAAVYAGQEKMPDIPAMTDRKLKSLIEEASGIEIVEKAYGIAREELRDASTFEQEKNDAVVRVKDVAEQFRSLLERMEVSAAKWSSERAEIIKTSEEKVQSAALQIIDAEAKFELEEGKGYAEKDEKAAKRVTEVRAEIAEVDDAIAGICGEQDEISRLEKNVSRQESAVSLANRQALASTSMFNKAKESYENAESFLGEPCDACGKSKTKEDLAEIKSRLKKSAQEAKEEAVHDRAVLKEEKEKLDEATGLLEDRKKTQTDISSEIARKRDLLETLDKLTQARETLSRKLKTVSQLKLSVEQARVEYKQTAERVETLRKEKNPHLDNVEKARSDLETALEAIEPAEAAYREASRKVLIAKQVVETFGPKGVRAHILDTVTPFLNDRTAYYLSTLSDGTIEAVWTTLTESSTGDLREKFSIMVQKNGEGKFAGLSGGEKRKVRLATMLALQDLVASRASKPINLWVGDEIDTALDPAGLERLMSLLEMKAREKGTVLIVSHHDLKDWVRDTVTVTMKDQQATVEGVLCRSL